MRKWCRIASVLLLIAILSGLTWWALSGPPEPVYQGKRLSVWLRGYDAPVWDGGTSVESIMADDAVRRMGTNSLQYLLSALRAKDAPLKIKFFELLRQQHFINVNHTSADDLNRRAACAFLALGETASNAAPKLIKIYTGETNEQQQYVVAEPLGAIGPAASNAVPVLLSRMQVSNWFVQSAAIWAAGKIHAQPEIVVPVLIKLTGETDGYAVCGPATTALGCYGSNAFSAIPFLVTRLQTETNDSMADEIRRAIKAIGSETSANVGLK